MSDDQTYDGTMRLNTEKIVMAKKVVRRDVLDQIEGPGSPRQIILNEDMIVIGRSPEANIQLRSNMVSRKHICLSPEGGELICKDLDSHNGLILNGIPIQAAALRDGDMIQIGDIVFRFFKGVQWTSS